MQNFENLFKQSTKTLTILRTKYIWDSSPPKKR